MGRTGTTSRPTPGRGFQRLPSDAGVQAQYEAENVSVPDWASSPFTLYISYLHGHVPEKMLFSVLRQAGLGMMNKDKAIVLTKHEARDGGYPFQSAKIHFDFLFSRGDDGERNLQVLDHLLHGGEDAHFQVVYQAARVNPKTGKEEPDRFWKVKAWREGISSPSPAGAPAVKISLGGGSIGPKDVSRASATAKPSAQDLMRRRAPTKATTDADGFTTPKQTAGSAAVTTAVSSTKHGTTGGFSALAVKSPPPSTAPMSKTARKNANRRANRAATANSPTDEDTATPTEPQVVHDEPVKNDGYKNTLTGAWTSSPQLGLTEAERAEVDAAIQRAEEGRAFANDAAAFLAENQIAEEGMEAPTAMMNSAFGMEIVAETSASEAEQLVPAADTAHFSAN